MQTSYEIYNNIALNVQDTTLMNGRYLNQKHAEPLIVRDIINKLALNKDDCVLDIGCGSGMITFAIANIVRKVYGIDTPSAVKKLCGAIGGDSNCEFFSGDYLENEFTHVGEEKITKILAYSVIHYLRSYNEAIQFVDKALQLLSRDGKILIGDLPNVSKKKRFLNTEYGQKFDAAFKENYQERKQEESERDEFWKDSAPTVMIDDEFIYRLMKYYRDLGHEVYLLPQEYYLPFGYTREDLLIVKA